MEKNCKKKPSSRRAKWLDKKWMPNAIILTFALLVLYLCNAFVLLGHHLATTWECDEMFY